MATTSTITTVKRQLVSMFTSALAGEANVKVTYAWPGPGAGNEMVFLGQHPEVDDILIDATSEIPNIKASRKQRQESYRVPVTLWSFRPDLDVDDAETCEVRTEALFGLIADVLADDPRIGLTPQTVQSVVLEHYTPRLFPFNGGWASYWLLEIQVEARLT